MEGAFIYDHLRTPCGRGRGDGALHEITPVEPAVEELKRRFLATTQALQAARCVEEGVVADPVDADVDSILGIGYPAWTGGVLSLLSYIETVCLPRFVEQATELAQRHGKRYRPSPWLVERAQRNEILHRPMALAA